MKQAKAVQARLAHLPKVARPNELVRIKMDFSLTTPPDNQVVLECTYLHFSYGSHLIFDDASFYLENHHKVCLFGANGTGKTTLLRCIEENESSIRKVPRAKIGFLDQEFKQLDPKKTLLQNATSSSVQSDSVIRTVLARLLFTQQVLHKRVEVLSGGEKTKRSFAKLMLSECNLLILDEPTNYLDLMSVEVLSELLRNYQGTVLFVSHDQHLINHVATDLLIINNHKLELFVGNLFDYFHTQTANKKSITVIKA